MNRFLVNLLKLPVVLFVTSIDVLLKNMREFQGVFDRLADDLATDTSDSVRAALAAPAPPSVWGAGENLGRHMWDSSTNNFSSCDKENEAMAGVDLGGDDVKNVSYWITFVKPDFVATLQGMKDETIDYATDEGSFGGLKLGAFFQVLGADPPVILWPKAWTTPPSNDYVKVVRFEHGQKVEYLKNIPESERKYLRFNLKLNWRQPQPDAEREKDKIQVLREIRDKIH